MKIIRVMVALYIFVVVAAVWIAVAYGPDLVVGIVDRVDFLIGYPEK